jgi:hypothetical protein
MSRQVVAAKKRKQECVTTFFKPKPGVTLKKPRVETVVQGRVKTYDCGFCGKSFSPQGIKAHELWHIGRGDMRGQAWPRPFGKVKVVGEPYSRAASSSGANEDMIDVEVIDCTAETAVDNTSNAATVMIVDERGNHHECVAQESGSVTIQERPMAPANMSIYHRIEILDYYQNSVQDDTVKFPKAATVKWVQSQPHFNRPKFSRQNLNMFIETEVMIRTSSGTKKKSKYAKTNSRDGMFPEMEIKLSQWITETRSMGIPVETFMLPIIGREMLVEQYPERYAGEESPEFVEPLGFSNSWRIAFSERHGFSICRFTTTKTILRDKVKVAETIKNFHLETRTFQLSFTGPPKDPVYGITSPYAVFNRDQVPIALCPSIAKTLDHTGAPVVLNSLDLNNKRFCTLNLTVPNEVRPQSQECSQLSYCFPWCFQRWRRLA